jgi:hypothetical protein
MRTDLITWVCIHSQERRHLVRRLLDRLGALLVKRSMVREVLCTHRNRVRQKREWAGQRFQWFLGFFFETGSHCVVRAGFYLAILLLQHPECWDYTDTSHCSWLLWFIFITFWNTTVFIGISKGITRLKQSLASTSFYSLPRKKFGFYSFWMLGSAGSG